MQTSPTRQKTIKVLLPTVSIKHRYQIEQRKWAQDQTKMYKILWGTKLFVVCRATQPNKNDKMLITNIQIELKKWTKDQTKTYKIQVKHKTSTPDNTSVKCKQESLRLMDRMGDVKDVLRMFWAKQNWLGYGWWQIPSLFLLSHWINLNELACVCFDNILVAVPKKRT